MRRAPHEPSRLFGAVRLLAIVLAFAVAGVRSTPIAGEAEISAIAAISAFHKAAPSVASMRDGRPALQRALPGRPLLELHHPAPFTPTAGLPPIWGGFAVASAVVSGSIDFVSEEKCPRAPVPPRAIARGPPRSAV